jgi:hypothetical protein
MALVRGYYSQDLVSDLSPLRDYSYDTDFYNNTYKREGGYTFEDVLLGAS